MEAVQVPRISFMLISNIARTRLVVTAQRSCSLNAGCRSRDAFGALHAAWEWWEASQCYAIPRNTSGWLAYEQCCGFMALHTDTGSRVLE